MSTTAGWDDVEKATPALGDFLTGDEKAALFQSQRPFFVIGAKPQYTSQFGERTQFTVIVERGGEPRNLDLSHNGYRQARAEQVLKMIADGTQAIGPCYLHKFRTNGGNDAWEIASAPMGTPVPAAAPPAAPAAPAAPPAAPPPAPAATPPTPAADATSTAWDSLPS